MHAANPLRARSDWALLGAVAIGWFIGCASPQEQGAAGSSCFRSDDCEEGLVCIPSRRVGGNTNDGTCTKDLSEIISMGEGPPPMNMTGAGGADAPATGGTTYGGSTASGATGGTASAGTANGGTGATAGTSTGGTTATGATGGDPSSSGGGN
jgi:hypothetical protein